MGSVAVLAAVRVGSATRAQNAWMNSNHHVPAAVQRVAEIASLLAEDRPAAKQLVKELFARFLEVQEHYRRPQAIQSAPLDADALQLYCPNQGGWQYGKWLSAPESRWIAKIDERITLSPTHWKMAESPALPDEIERR
jgi:hypothetical protein